MTNLATVRREVADEEIYKANFDKRKKLSLRWSELAERSRKDNLLTGEFAINFWSIPNFD